MYCIIFIQKLKFSGFDLSFQFIIIEDGTKVVWWWVVVKALCRMPKIQILYFLGLNFGASSILIGSEVGSRKSEFSNSEPWPGL